MNYASILYSSYFLLYTMTIVFYLCTWHLTDTLCLSSLPKANPPCALQQKSNEHNNH